MHSSSSEHLPDPQNLTALQLVHKGIVALDQQDRISRGQVDEVAAMRQDVLWAKAIVLAGLLELVSSVHLNWLGLPLSL